MAKQRISDNLRLLLEIGETATAGEDLSLLFDRILDAILLALEVETASLMLADKDGFLRIRAARGVAPEIVRETKVAPGEGISGFVLLTGEAILIEDLARDGRFPSSGCDRYANRSLLSVPIRYGGRTLGVLNVNNKFSGDIFSPADLDLLTAMAHHAALSVENFHLVADLRRQARELEAANRDLLRLNQTRSRLICTLSHELNTPLTSILGYVDFILNHSEQAREGELRDHLQRVDEQGRRMEGLINGMLRLFSYDAGEEEWMVSTFSLGELIGEALRRRAAEIEGKLLRLETELPVDLPAFSGDREKMGVMVDALIDNAIKFNRPGGRLGIRVTVLPSGRIHLQLHNDGRTVPADAAEEIFAGFHQLGDIDTEKPPGVGIGLATCRIIAERMNGRIFLEAPEGGEGTTLGLLLPMSKGVDG